MAKKPNLPPAEDVLNTLAASVHSFDSFGRAIVAAALSEAAKSGTSVAQSKVTATVQVTPLGHRSSTDAFSAGSSAAGAGAAGPATAQPSISVTICIGDSCYVMGV